MSKPQCPDIIVIGSSAGGLPALMELVAGLPANFPAAILVVQHIPPYSESNLHNILSRLGPLPALAAKDGEKVMPGHIYVAIADHHLLVEKEKLIVRKGPRENRFRPSVDALFRSAAYTYGNRVIGIVLSGALDDGTSGLWTIKRLGGLALIQHPQDALFPQMPVNAEQFVTVDYSIPASQMPALLSELTVKPVKSKPKITKKELALLQTEIVIATRDNAFQMGIIKMGELTPFTCPECHGALSQLKEGKIIRFRCHTGHAYTISSLLSEVTDNVETILWQAMQALEETTMLLTKVAEHFESGEQGEIAKLFYRKAEIIKKRSQLVHDTVLTQEIMSTDLGLSQP
ncbi:Protein-glutamate methylesterase/protein-glutamine glutaminase [Dyadobacter sp. CECT 9623]|uniref:protein-glutamate methylesterase n=1 Tax=Dyadobacter linearis TaxID=2823330 RepID=A0ABN7RIQ3_9BACT|nr:chemotaxis protein CheB [Dyadobacter sp. CECT 9623]CAG5074790.1 Protein-glutamate methylesterase/protein-glutamine glutaminase [Dyadobacter sp. CECT 9623]